MSVSQQGVEITNRFFLAIDILKGLGKIKSLRQITEMYGLNYGNTHKMMTCPQAHILKPELIAKLSLDFNISVEWILLGKGAMFQQSNNKCLHKKVDSNGVVTK